MGSSPRGPDLHLRAVQQDEPVAVGVDGVDLRALGDHAFAAQPVGAEVAVELVGDAEILEVEFGGGLDDGAQIVFAVGVAGMAVEESRTSHWRSNSNCRTEQVSRQGQFRSSQLCASFGAISFMGESAFLPEVKKPLKIVLPRIERRRAPPQPRNGPFQEAQ